MEYEINVAKPTGKLNWKGEIEYRHYFKVTVPYGNVKIIYDELSEKFPDCKLSVMCYSKIGQSVDIEKCNF